MDLDHVAAEIRAELGRQEMSESELGRRMGHKPDWINRRLHRTSRKCVDLSLVEIATIADLLHVHPDNLTGP